MIVVVTMFGCFGFDWFFGTLIFSLFYMFDSEVIIVVILESEEVEVICYVWVVGLLCQVLIEFQLFGCILLLVLVCCGDGIWCLVQ